MDSMHIVQARPLLGKVKILIINRLEEFHLVGLRRVYRKHLGVEHRIMLRRVNHLLVEIINTETMVQRDATPVFLVDICRRFN